MIKRKTEITAEMMEEISNCFDKYIEEIDKTAELLKSVVKP